MNRLGRLAAFATLPLLAGCFDYSMTLSVAPNGTATMVMEYAVAADMMAMGGMEPDDFCSDEQPEDLPDGFTVTSVESERDGDLVCTMTGIGPLAALPSFAETADFSPDEDGAPQIAITDEGGGVYRFNVLMYGQGSPDMTPDDMAMMSMMMPMFEGRELYFAVTAPQILETNGVVEGNTSSLTIPVSGLVTEIGTEYSLTVRFSD